MKTVYFDTNVWDFIGKGNISESVKSNLRAGEKVIICCSPLVIQQLLNTYNSDIKLARQLVYTALELSQRMFLEHSALMQGEILAYSQGKVFSDYFFDSKIFIELFRGAENIEDYDAELINIIARELDKGVQNKDGFKKIKEQWINNYSVIPKGKSFQEFWNDVKSNPVTTGTVKEICEELGILNNDPIDYKENCNCLHLYNLLMASRIYYHNYLMNGGINKDIYNDIKHHIYGRFCNYMVTRDEDMLEIYNNYIVHISLRYKIPIMLHWSEFEKNILGT
ncbi:MAG: hypothetical protein V1794_05920 [Candidatus Glassbacteria bacterium]